MSALFEVLLAAHILCAVVGFGSILVTGGYASLARPRPDRSAVRDSVRQYFRPGLNWASQVIFLVPVFGLVLAGMGGGYDFHQPWLWIGSGLWLFAAGVAFGLVWPAERRIASLLAVDGLAVDGLAVDGLAVDGSPVDGLAVDGSPVEGAKLEGETASLAGSSRRAALGAGAIDLAVVAAFVVMVGRIGG